ncbi:MAG TPA: hypothetical protein VM848_15980 [Acidimicrobiia bacterium]|nr:hypothetical protein [Acidimicrobiia bacterium]
MNTTLSPEATAYLDAVRDRLKGLPVEETDELVTDLEQHLVELMAEDTGPLVERLGSPQEYAIELVASAGWPTTQARSPVSLTRVFSGWKAHMASSAVLRWWSQHWPAYRPGWWIGRALLIGLILAAVNGSGRPAHLLWIAPLAIASVAAGRGAATSHRWRSVSLLMTVAAVFALIVGVVSGVRVMPQSVIYTYYDYNPDWIVGPNGVVEAIYAYDTEGQPVDVFLYDQNGSPLATNWHLYDNLSDGNGEPIGNFYPTERIINGQPVPRPAITVPEVPGD